ncbi:hypothetical protein BJV82DRAFT_672633 [Fennellomyces sp. T-0311]|nr:hypothetical protein BJV82DRAFT_672633 [Fennellomyces sp. T-0311]
MENNTFEPFLTQDYWDSLGTDPMWFDPMSSGSDVFLTPEEDIHDYGLTYPSNSVDQNTEADAKRTKEATICFNCECTETPVWRRENGQSILTAIAASSSSLETFKKKK